MAVSAIPSKAKVPGGIQSAGRNRAAAVSQERTSVPSAQEASRPAGNCERTAERAGWWLPVSTQREFRPASSTSTWMQESSSGTFRISSGTRGVARKEAPGVGAGLCPDIGCFQVDVRGTADGIGLMQKKFQLPICMIGRPDSLPAGAANVARPRKAGNGKMREKPVFP